VLYTQDRTQQRQFLANAWQKFLNKEGLKPDGPWACCFSVRKKSFQRCNPSFYALLRAGL
jgi:hypothetical protein